MLLYPGAQASTVYAMMKAHLSQCLGCMASSFAHCWITRSCCHCSVPLASLSHEVWGFSQPELWHTLNNWSLPHSCCESLFVLITLRLCAKELMPYDEPGACPARLCCSLTSASLSLDCCVGSHMSLFCDHKAAACKVCLPCLFSLPNCLLASQISQYNPTPSSLKPKKYLDPSATYTVAFLHSGKKRES